MAGPQQIATLADVEAWLGELGVGGTVEISPARFTAPLVKAVLELLPAPLSLEITAVEPSEGNLTGHGEVLSEQMTAALAFSEATRGASPLVGQLTLEPPPGFEWRPLDQVALGIGSIKGTLAPDPELGVAHLTLAATLNAGETDPLHIPIEISVPSYDGDWHLSGSFDRMGELSGEALVALAGGGAEANDAVAKVAKDLEHLNLTNLEAAFNPFQKTFSLVGMTFEYTEKWTFFDRHFELDTIRLGLAVFEPVKDPTLQVALEAELEIGGVPIDVGGSYPDMTVYAHLAPGAVLKVTDAFKSLHVNLPSDFPEIDVTALAFFFYIGADAFEFQLGVGETKLIGDVALDSFFFTMRADYAAGKVTPSGAVHSQLSFGETKLLLAGEYAETGFKLEGKVEDLHVEDIVAKLTEFGVNSVPAPIEKLDLEELRLEVDSGAGKFSFHCKGKTEVAGVEVEFAPWIELKHGSGGFEPEFGGTLILTSGTEKLEFEVKFSDTHSDEYLLATFKATPESGLGLEALAEALQLDLPSLPGALRLTLDEVGLRYDFTANKESLVLGAGAQGYGAAVLAALPHPEKWQLFLVFEASGGFSLSNLPLVGKELAQIEELSISHLLAVIGSEKAGKETTAAVNAAIANLKGKYPPLPEGSGPLSISAKLEIGTEPTPLEISLGEEPNQLETQAQIVAKTTAAESGGTTWFEVQKSFGPVTVKRLGVMYQSSQETLWFELDADLLFGPLALSLEGLGIGSPLKSFDPSFDLRGLGVSYQQPPLDVAGALINLEPPNSKTVQFAGGVVVGTPELKLQAFGYYGDKSGFSSMFLFGDLEYPLGGPPAFFVTGLALGFGYNSALRIPEIAEVGEFPLVATLPGSTAAGQKIFGANPTPPKVLEYMLAEQGGKKAWVKASAGSLWFAAGITFTSFELVRGQALVMVETGDELVIALVGTAATEFPQRDEQTSGQVYARVELDVLVRLAPEEGVFSAQALLSPSSFLLDPSCVLTGGFAFFVWFGKSEFAGDFVFTVGGYNPGFVPPPHYPTVPEVGFNWSLDDSISISGGAYLAITPAVLMAGARLDATYHSGNLKAWFNAHADILIRWKPFWIEAGVGITVGASYHIHFLGISWTPSVELGCELEVWGPPTGGRVHVDWYVISFTIPFGNGGDRPESLKTWEQVEHLLPDAAHPAKTKNVLGMKPGAGLVPPAGEAAEPKEGPWLVRGGHFSFEATTVVPVTSGTVGSQQLPGGHKFNVHPLAQTEVESSYTLTITPTGGSGDVTTSFAVTPTGRDLPASLWGAPPEENGKPQVPASDQQLVRGQLVGATLTVNPPQLGPTAGAITVATSLAQDPLELPSAQMTLSATAAASGDVPAPSAPPGTVALIAEPAGGIASTKVAEARSDLYRELLGAGLAPAGCEASMSEFATAAPGAFAAEPLFVK
ncbi:MAG TPA: DUF6603 domain-containing protein [Solirubrobacterales bacterium]|nr:DUF6603 domain-containing protein [Solirubrobacterales bacterium]